MCETVVKARLVSCPRCGTQVAWSPGNPYRPFCSERCKLIDLGDWAMEKYRVPVEEDKDPPEANRTEDS
ncbi:MAG: DNA gyrase inhibitor YacG [Betaproteobacteria bacterium]|nr:MAG: DNA gyrase inhibitor YacG [Betaproteobacteria bacterium]